MDSPNELLFGVRLNQSGSLTILRHSFYYPPPPLPTSYIYMQHMHNNRGERVGGAKSCIVQ